MTPQLNFFLNSKNYLEYKTFLSRIAYINNKGATIFQTSEVKVSVFLSEVDVTCIDRMTTIQKPKS